MARATRASSKAFDRRTVYDLDAGQRFDEFGERRAPHAVAGRRRDDNRQFQRFCGFGQGHYVVFQLSDRIVADAAHEADLMIDKDERRVLGSQGFVRSGLI
jgi:hypothetical protein